MQTSIPSDRAGAIVNRRRIGFALGLAILVAITSIATNRTETVRTDASTRPQVSIRAAAAQPYADVAVSFPRMPGVRKKAASKAQPARRSSRTAEVFDSAARAELHQSIRESMKLSVAKLGDELARSIED